MRPDSDSPGDPLGRGEGTGDGCLGRCGVHCRTNLRRPFPPSPPLPPVLSRRGGGGARTEPPRRRPRPPFDPPGTGAHQPIPTHRRLLYHPRPSAPPPHPPAHRPLPVHRYADPSAHCGPAMFFFVTLEKYLIVPPHLFGKTLKDSIYERLRNEVEGTCSGKHGYILQVSGARRVERSPALGSLALVFWGEGERTTGTASSFFFFGHSADPPVLPNPGDRNRRLRSRNYPGCSFIRRRCGLFREVPGGSFERASLKRASVRIQFIFILKDLFSSLPLPPCRRPSSSGPLRTR